MGERLTIGRALGTAFWTALWALGIAHSIALWAVALATYAVCGLAMLAVAVGLAVTLVHGLVLALGVLPPPLQVLCSVLIALVLAVAGGVRLREWWRDRPRSDEWLIDHRRGRIAARDEVGALWELDRPDWRTRTVVEVYDATPRPDGSHARYLLRVPPNVRTPREAVAWTFGFEDGSDYRPLVET